MNKDIFAQIARDTGKLIADKENKLIRKAMLDLIEVGRLEWEDVAMWNFQKWETEFTAGSVCINLPAKTVFKYNGESMFYIEQYNISKMDVQVI